MITGDNYTSYQGQYLNSYTSIRLLVILIHMLLNVYHAVIYGQDTHAPSTLYIISAHGVLYAYTLTLHTE